jgi:CHAT domain-containing protein/tetratricopeptide (TPR) repeat protein
VTPPHLRPSWLGLFGIAAALLGLSGGAASPPLLTTRDLSPGDSIALSMRAEEVHEYGFPLESGQVFEVWVREHGVDLSVELAGPGLPQGLKVDGPAGSQVFEKIFAVARASGTHRLRLAAGKKIEDGAHYILFTRPSRQAMDKDRTRAEALTLFLRGEDARRNKNWEQAILFYQQAIEKLAVIEETELRATAFYRVGSIKDELEKWEEAVAAYEQALVFSNDLSEQVIVTGRLAQDLARLDRPDDARKRAEDALEEARRSGDSLLLGKAFSSAGSTYNLLGQGDLAVEHYLDALEAFGQSPAGLPTISSLGGLYYHRGDIPNALGFALQLDAEGVEGPHLIGRSFLAADARVAVRFLSEARKRASHHEEAFQARVLCDLGSALLKCDRVEEAEAAFLEGLQRAEQAEDSDIIAYAQAGLGRVLRLRGDHEKSLVFLNDAAAGLAKYRDSLALVLSGRALTERDQGDLDAALATTEQATELIEEERRRFESLRARASFLGAWADPYEIQIDILLELDQERPGQGYAERALETGEEIRARALFEGLSRTTLASSPEETQELLRRQDEMTSQLRLLEGKMAGAGGPADLAEIETRIEALLSENEALREEFFRSHPQYEELARPEPLSASEIQSLLDSGTALLAYTLGDERSVLSWVDPGGVTLVELAPGHEIEAAATRLHHLLRQSRNSKIERKIERVSKDLWRLVLAPVADRLTGVHTLVIIPDGALQLIPFAVLPNPRTGELLVSDHVSVYLPSASILDVLRRRAAGRSWDPEKRFAALAHPVLQPDDKRLRRSPVREGGLNDDWRQEDSLPDLPKTEEEALAVSRMFPGGSWTAIGLEAVPEVATNGHLGGYQYVHLGTHGIVHERQPELSGVVLSQFDADGRRVDGRLRLYDILHLNLTADLVSLSTCRSAAGPMIPREGPIALSRSFLFAGATRVLGTLWEVEDGAAYDMTTRFYRHVSQGKTPAQALREAQNELKDTSPANDWAAFVLQGDWR